MATTMTTVDNILKEVYEPRVRDQLQSEMVTIKRIERTSEGVSQDAGGKYVRFSVRVKRNHGVGARNEMDPLPVAKTQGYETSQLKLKHLYGSVQLTGQTFELASTNPQAFASALDLEIDGMNETVRKDVNRQVYGGTKGVLATATAGGSTTEFVTDNAQYLEVGMVVDVYDSTDTDGSHELNNSKIEITDIEETSAGVWTVTLDPAVIATATGDFLTRTGSRGKEKTGLDQIVKGSDGDGTGELYNITHRIWTGNVDSTGGAITEGRMTAMVDKIRRRGGKTTAMFSDDGIQRAYANLLIQQRRYQGTTEFTGGFSGLKFVTQNGDIPLVADFDCKPGDLWFINESVLKLYQAGDWSWMDRDGSKWKQVTSGDGEHDAYRATLYKYCELGTFQRNSHGVMTGLTSG